MPFASEATEKRIPSCSKIRLKNKDILILINGRKIQISKSIE